MTDNTVSFEDGCRLIEKLFSEQTPLSALLIIPTGTPVRVIGSVDSITPEAGLVISSSRPPSSGVALISLPFFGRDCAFTFGDNRDLPEERRDELATKFGDTMLCLRFLDSEEFLVLTLTTLTP